ncbi:MAG: hypothetical protein K9W43_12615 [Candidatus Thorarchaeota archaeon]|nr:hypothetical protein [Candidatus Thorarchaeota archaeon]
MLELKVAASRSGTITVGYRGGSERVDVSYSRDLGIWWLFNKYDNRYWTGFGLEEPEWESKISHNTVCEINIPYKHTNRRSQGIIAKDEKGRYYVLHRGGIRGREQGISKQKFFSEYRGKLVDVRDEAGIANAALVGAIGEPSFPAQVANFVQEVYRIKHTKTGTKQHDPRRHSFSPEFSGQKEYPLYSDQVRADCSHGFIVNTLAQELLKRGIETANTQQVDLYIPSPDNEQNFAIVFEIKTTTSPYSVYVAIGQLLFHTANEKKRPTLVAVFPKNIRKFDLGKFSELGIECLTYIMDGNSVAFDGQTLGKICALIQSAGQTDD